MMSPYIYPGLYSVKFKIPHPSDAFSKALRLVCDELNVDMRHVLSSRRHRAYVIARQMLSYVLRNRYRLTLKYIGMMMGNRDHSTIIHSNKQHLNDYAQSKYYREVYDRVCRNL